MNIGPWMGWLSYALNLALGAFAASVVAALVAVHGRRGTLRISKDSSRTSVASQGVTASH
jgi:hypothetical protein